MTPRGWVVGIAVSIATAVVLLRWWRMRAERLEAEYFSELLGGRLTRRRTDPGYEPETVLPPTIIVHAGELKPDTMAAMQELGLALRQAAVNHPELVETASTGADIQPVRCQVCRRVLRGAKSIHLGAGRRCRARIKQQTEREGQANG